MTVLPPHEYVFYGKQLLAAYSLPDSWRIIVVPDMGRRLGTCNVSKQLIRLNGKHLTTGPHELILDTVRHEIAHAVAASRYGTDIKPHGPQWKSVAVELGATPRASVPLTAEQKALQAKARASQRYFGGIGFAAGKGFAVSQRLPATKRKHNKKPPASFYSSDIRRDITFGDLFTVDGKTYQVIETKRTRFTGRALHDGKIYSIPAVLLQRGAVTAQTTQSPTE